MNPEQQAGLAVRQPIVVNQAPMRWRILSRIGPAGMLVGIVVGSLLTVYVESWYFVVHRLSYAAYQVFVRAIQGLVQ